MSKRDFVEVWARRCALVALLFAQACSGCGDDEDGPRDVGTSNGDSGADVGDRDTAGQDDIGPGSDLGQTDMGTDGGDQDGDMAGDADMGPPPGFGSPWIEVSPALRSPRWFSHSMTWDSGASRMLLVDQGIVMSWDGAQWTKIAEEPALQDRLMSAAVWDPVREQLVMFGGREVNTDFKETWLWDGTTFTMATPANVPPARNGTKLVWDAANERVVMFGGGRSIGDPLGDTWAWDGTDWTELATGPAPRYQHNLGYDPVRERVVLYSGYTAGSILAEDTWEFDGTTWDDVTSPTGPLGLGFATMVYDPARSKVLMIGGINSGDTWAWDGNEWTSLTSAVGALDQRAGAAGAWDPVAAVVMLHGGRDLATGYATTNTLAADDTWRDITPNLGQPPERYAAAMAFDAARGVTVLFGGALSPSNLATDETWTWDGTNWTTYLTIAPPARLGAMMAYDAARERIVMFGGIPDSGLGFLGDTWVWDGAQWSLAVADGAGPEARTTASFGYDPGGERVLMHSGRTLSASAFAETWAWDGTAWSLVTDTGPVTVWGTQLVHDTVNDRMLLWTGSELWALEVDAWSLVDGSSTIGERRLAAAFWDTRRSSFVMFGGDDADLTAHNDTWEFSGGTWTELTPTVSPPRLDLGGIAFDTLRQRAVRFGGIQIASTWEWDGALAP